VAEIVVVDKKRLLSGHRRIFPEVRVAMTEFFYGGLSWREVELRTLKIKTFEQRERIATLTDL